MGDPGKADQMDEILARFGNVQEEYQQGGGYELEARAREVLHGLGFEDDGYFYNQVNRDGGVDDEAIALREARIPVPPRHAAASGGIAGAVLNAGNIRASGGLSPRATGGAGGTILISSNTSASAASQSCAASPMKPRDSLIR